MDKFIIRISVILINIWMLASLAYAWDGVTIEGTDSLFGVSLLNAIVLLVIVFAQGNYHCKWMQSLSVNILFTQIINILSSYFGLFEDAALMLYILSYSWGISTILAFYFAISHFVKVQKLKRKKLNQYSQINGNSNTRSESED